MNVATTSEFFLEVMEVVIKMMQIKDLRCVKDKHEMSDNAICTFARFELLNAELVRFQTQAHGSSLSQS